MNPRVITFGAAVQDVFLQGKVFTPKHEDGEDVEEFLLGSKNEIDSVTFSTGGGATNAAVTFARQGLEAAYFGKVGKDLAGQNIKQSLANEQVDTTLITLSELGTGFSALLLAPNGERTILTYRGASTHYDIPDSQLDYLQADWFYISSMDGNFDVLEQIMLHAKEQNIRVVWNPGKKELEEPDEVKALLANVTVLSLNKEEMATLFVGETMQDLVSSASRAVDFAVVTDGPRGVAATDGKVVMAAGMYKDVPVVDRTGAGDAFCSGFAAALMREQGLKQAITLGSANSTSVVGKIGAKAGILYENAQLLDMPVTSEPL